MLAVVGSRTLKDYQLVSTEIKNLVGENRDIPNLHYIISGGAAGADTLAELYAKENGVKMKILKPDWQKYGKKAGILRNKDIVENANFLLAFWDGKSPGTKHIIAYAKIKNLPVKVVKIN